MYSATIEVKMPRQCYFCLETFNGINDFAILEGHVFCPRCGYEVMESKLEVVKQESTPEDYGHDMRLKRIGAATR